MSPDEIKHFLVSFDPTTGKTAVREFGNDYDMAQAAYVEAERSDAEGQLDVVLIGADSLKTIEQTHSSYFAKRGTQIKELLALA